MTPSAELVSIAEAARRLGTNRPKMSVLLKEAGIEKVKARGQDMVPFEDAQAVFQRAAAEGKIMGPKKTKDVVVTPTTAISTAKDGPTMTQLTAEQMDRLLDKIDALTTAKDALTQENRRLYAICVSHKLLPPAETASARQGATSSDEWTEERLDRIANPPSLWNPRHWPIWSKSTER